MCVSLSLSLSLWSIPCSLYPLSVIHTFSYVITTEIHMHKFQPHTDTHRHTTLTNTLSPTPDPSLPPTCPHRYTNIHTRTDQVKGEIPWPDLEEQGCVWRTELIKPQVKGQEDICPSPLTSGISPCQDEYRNMLVTVFMYYTCSYTCSYTNKQCSYSIY